jgi:Leucine-rich repeat (LRR) protein
MHFGAQGCLNILNLNASNNQIKYISSRIKDCANLICLDLNVNQIAGKDFLPTEFLNS